MTAEQLQELWRQISAAAFILSLLIASVSLGVGGIVITNIMLVAVVERTADEEGEDRLRHREGE